MADANMASDPWTPSIAELKKRLQSLYPGVDMEDNKNWRAGHIQGVYTLALGAREMMLKLRGVTAPGIEAVAQTTFGAGVLKQISDWKIDHKEEITVLDRGLPSHESILAYKVLTESGEHPEPTVEALRGTNYDHLLYPKTVCCPCTAKDWGCHARLERRDRAAASVVEAAGWLIERRMDVPDGMYEFLRDLQEKIKTVEAARTEKWHQDYQVTHDLLNRIDEWEVA